MSGELLRLKAELDAAKGRYSKACADARATCEHKTLLECDYEPSLTGLFAPLLPLRICEDCGLEEEGWSFRVLTGRAYKAPRIEIYCARKDGRRLAGLGKMRASSGGATRGGRR